MYLNKQKKPNGDIYLSIREKYHVPGKGARERVVEKVGYVSILKEQYNDPIAYFTQRAKVLTNESKKAKAKSIMINPNEKMAADEDNLKNVGYGILKEIYRELELDRFWRWKTRNKKIQYNMEHIFRLLVLSRILYPGSKKEAFDKKEIFFEPFEDFSLDDVYHSLDVVAKNIESLQQWIFKRSEKLTDRDLSVSYFDCTNYYFDIGRPDVDLKDEDGNIVDENGDPARAKYRKRGPEKNKRPDPIVGMGLLMDRNGIPLAYDLYPGNESEKLHMRPVLQRVKNDYSDTRTIIVADRGLNTSDNIYFINGDNKGDINERDGYVYGQSVRGADAEFKAWVLSGGYKTDLITSDDGQTVTFTHKSRIYPKEIHVNIHVPGQKKTKKKTVRIDQKQMAYYSERYARKQKTDREAMIARAKDMIAHPKKYDRISASGSKSYVKNIAFDKETGEIVEGRELYLDLEKIEEEEKYDGYYSIVTSELEMDDHELRDIYRGLARIEDTFKVSKTEFESRPVYVWTTEHIDAHFATCFTALVIIRLLQAKTGNKYPVGKMLESLKKYQCTQLDTNYYQFLYYDEFLESCGKTFGLDLSKKYHTRQEIQRMLHY
jgi:transposase